MKKRKKTTPVTPEVQETNLVNKLTLEILSKRHNALARYLGIPCTVPVTEVLKGAVMADATVVPSQKYACYRVDLTPFKGEFDRVRFRATTDGKDVVFGMLVDKDDNPEFTAKADEPGAATINIPLSAKSTTLFATMPLKNGKPAWENVTVELLTNGGVINNVNEALCTLLEKIEALETRVEELIPTSETQLKINLC